MDLWMFVLLFVFVALTSMGLFYLYRTGCFHIVQVFTGRPDFYEMKIAYKLYRGDYKESGKPFDAITKLCPGLTCISVYYDDPNKVAAEQCRYICGVVLAEGPDEKPDADTMRKLRENDFRFHTLPRVESVIKATFPFTTSLSPMIGAIRTYPKIVEYAKEKKLKVYPYLEICTENMIHYMGPLSRHEEFCVEEVQD